MNAAHQRVEDMRSDELRHELSALRSFVQELGYEIHKATSTRDALPLIHITKQ